MNITFWWIVSIVVATLCLSLLWALIREAWDDVPSPGFVGVMLVVLLFSVISFVNIVTVCFLVYVFLATI